MFVNQELPDALRGHRLESARNGPTVPHEPWLPIPLEPDTFGRILDKP
jgi:hypothetical protein